MLGGGGQAGTDDTEPLGVREGTEATGDLLAKLDDTDRTSGCAVVERHAGTHGEAQVVVITSVPFMQ